MTLFSMITLALWMAISFFIIVFAVLNMGAELRLLFSNGTQTISALLCGLFCYRTMLVFPVDGPMRSVWGMIGSGAIAWGLGNALYSAYPIFIEKGVETPYPWYSDIGFLALVPLMVAGLLAFKRTLGLTAPLWGQLLASVLFAVGLAFGTWANWGGLFAEDRLMQVVSVAYVIFDPLLLAVTVLVASGLRGGQAAQPWWYLLAGLLLYYAANLTYSYLRLINQYATGLGSDILWPVGFGLIAIAAMMTHDFYADG